MGWLDNFGKVDNPNEGFSKAPFGTKPNKSQKGNNYNGAWNGQFQKGGRLPKTIKETIPSLQPKLNPKELKNILADFKEFDKTADLKKPRAEANKAEKYLPNKSTKKFFAKAKEDYGYPIYKSMLQIQHERGNPAVNVGTDKGLPFHAKRNYNPFTNEVNIPKENLPEFVLEDYISEVSHAGQPLSDVIPRWLGNDLFAYMRGKEAPYTTPGTVENYTHNVIGPKLEEKINNTYYPEDLPYDDYDLRRILRKPKFQFGGAIKDNMGQWKYPGEITQIDGNNITMKNVNYPVIGLSDEGDLKLMKPGKDYKFKGNNVTEYPIIKNGGTFTRKSSGWLDNL